MKSQKQLKQSSGLNKNDSLLCQTLGWEFKMV